VLNLVRNSSSSSYQGPGIAPADIPRSHHSSTLVFKKQTPIQLHNPQPHHRASEADFFTSNLSKMEQAKAMAERRSGLNDSQSIDKDAGLDEDECNLINKEDFEEGK
jgi:hypothetical protein